MLHQNLNTGLNCNWGFYKLAPEHSIDPSGHVIWTCGLHFNEIRPYKKLFAAAKVNLQLLQNTMSKPACAFFFLFNLLVHFQCNGTVTLLVNDLMQVSGNLLCSESIDIYLWWEEILEIVKLCLCSRHTCNVSRRTTRWKSLLIKSWALCFYHPLFRFMNVIWFLLALWTFFKEIAFLRVQQCEYTRFSGDIVLHDLN